MLQTVESEELLEAILGTLHNLSYFYQNETETLRSDNPASFHQRINDIALVLYDILQCSSINAQLEAAKILGNISRHSNIGDSLNAEKKINFLISCLAKEDTELLAAVVGILVNILSDWEKRIKFKELNGLIVIRKIFLRALSVHNWNLAALCCQAFWNFFIDYTSINDGMEREEGQLIANHIAENLGIFF